MVGCGTVSTGDVEEIETPPIEENTSVEPPVIE
jgi:hypothetical protein